MKKLISLIIIYLNVFSSSLIAGEGVIEINHICATQLGCVSGDTAGYPVTLNGASGRSYILTSDLIIPDENTDGVRVLTPNITIDLNGFSIIRSGCESTCSAVVGTGSGVWVTSGNYNSFSVFNGSVVGMGNKGLFLQGEYAKVNSMKVSYSGDMGIYTDKSALVFENQVINNGGIGISTGLSSQVKDNISSYNSLGGMSISNGSTIINNTVYNNGGDGIRAYEGCLLIGNSASNNTGYGLNMNSSSAFRENVVLNNTAGTVNGGVDLSNNSCNFASTCP